MYIYFGIYYMVRWGEMPLIRTTKMIGSRIVLSIPSQLVEAYDIGEGDELEIIPLGPGEFKIKKVEHLQGGVE